MHPRDRIEYRIGALKGAGLWRDPDADEPQSTAPEFVDARSNDYLGLAGRTVSRETTGAVGAGASRLVSGSHPEHRQLERELAGWLGFEECLAFSSGYAANVGVVSALVGPGETVLSDALNHASIIDGCRLSRAEAVVLPHRDLGALDRALTAGRGVRWVVTESYFGMDGDSPDLVAMRRVCDAHHAALIVDEAHAVGVFGPSGRGLCAAAGVTPDVLVGGMGKALGIHGGFAACASVYRDWLWNRARSLVFSTAPSPLLCSLALGRVNQVRQAEPERAHLRALERRLAERLSDAGVGTPEGRHGPLFPVVLGTEQAVLDGARRARELGVLCHPIRPPTVPRGASRLRVTLRADMSEADVDRIARALAAAWRERNVQQGPAEDRAPGARASLAGNELESLGSRAPRSARALDPAIAGGGAGSQRAKAGPGERETPGLQRAPNGPEGTKAREPLEGVFDTDERPSEGSRGVLKGAGNTLGEWSVFEAGGPRRALGDEGEGSRAAALGHPVATGATSAAQDIEGSVHGMHAGGHPAEPTVEARERGDAGSSPVTEPRRAEENSPARERSTERDEALALSPPSDAHPGEGTRPSTLTRRAGSEPPLQAQPRASASKGQVSSRWLVLGTGTGVGKTFVARALVRALAAAGEPVAGLKPVETGLAPGVVGDAAALAALAFHVKLPSPHPLYGFAEPVTPSRAARSEATVIDLGRIVRWTDAVVATAERAARVVIETAGGVFSPLSDRETNFDLALALGPATWILVAPNRLGVLHDVTSALHAMTAQGRRPDWIVLSAPEVPDASTSSNRDELGRLPWMPPVIELPRHDERPLEALLATPTR